MSTISIKIRAEELGKSIDNIADGVEQALQNAVSQLATAAYSEAIRLANQRLHQTKQDYINSLEFTKLDDNVYAITLKGQSANATEDGYSGFDMKPGLLSGPKAKIAQDGTRFNTIPLRTEPYSQAPASDKVKNMRDAVRTLIGERGLDKIIKDPSTGIAKQGIVARVYDTGVKDMEGLVKVQRNYGKSTSSYYMTFRTVSDRSSANSWKHPGYSGAHIFPDVEHYIEEQLDQILRTLL